MLSSEAYPDPPECAIIVTGAVTGFGKRRMPGWATPVHEWFETIRKP